MSNTTIPYPLVTNPATGEPFTAKEISELQSDIADAAINATIEVLDGARLDFLGWESHRALVKQFAHRSLHDTLADTQAGLEEI